jgi:hypothetical protein
MEVVGLVGALSIRPDTACSAPLARLYALFGEADELCFDSFRSQLVETDVEE